VHDPVRQGAHPGSQGEGFDSVQFLCGHGFTGWQAGREPTGRGARA
jgi:hypothetical protein